MAPRSGRAARRLARQSRRATRHTPPADNPYAPAVHNPLAQLLAEHRPTPNTKPLPVIYPHSHDPRLRRRQDQPDHQHAREHPRTKREQPPTRPRSILDSGLSRRNTVLRYPTREYESDHASRTRQARRPLSRATTAHRLKPTGPGLTPLPPYEFSSARRPAAGENFWRESVLRGEALWVVYRTPRSLWCL